MLKWLSKTFSIATAISVALLIGAWPLRADLLDGAMVVARTVVPPNVISSGPYTLQQSDAFRSAVWMAGGATATLPAASGLLNGSTITLCNSSTNDGTHHAILQPSFPAPAFGRLYMQQCESVTAVGSVWQVSSWQGRFRPGFTPTLFMDTSNGLDTNDGLVSNAAGNAIASLNQCFTLLQNEYDLSNGGIPICGPTGGQTFTGAPVYQHGGTGIGVIDIIGQGGTAVFRATNNVVLELSDFAGYLIVAGINFDCTSAGSHPCTGIFMHQQNGIDISSGCSGCTTANTFTGANAGDIAVWCDSMCKINSSTAPTLTGTFASGFKMDEKSALYLNSGLTIAASAAFTDIFDIYKGSSLVFSGTLTLGASNTATQVATCLGNGTNCIFATLTVSGSIGGGARQWAVLNNAFLCNGSSTAVPGSAGLSTPGSGYTAGIVTATSGTCSP